MPNFVAAARRQGRMAEVRADCRLALVSFQVTEKCSQTQRKSDLYEAVI